MKKNKMMWICSNCGSSNVQTKKWVDVNTDEIKDDVSDGESDDNWCEDCETHPYLSYIEIES